MQIRAHCFKKKKIVILCQNVFWQSLKASILSVLKKSVAVVLTNTNHIENFLNRVEFLPREISLFSFQYNALVAEDGDSSSFECQNDINFWQVPRQL